MKFVQQVVDKPVLNSVVSQVHNACAFSNNDNESFGGSCAWARHRIHQTKPIEIKIKTWNIYITWTPHTNIPNSNSIKNEFADPMNDIWNTDQLKSYHVFGLHHFRWSYPIKSVERETHQHQSQWQQQHLMRRAKSHLNKCKSNSTMMSCCSNHLWLFFFLFFFV